MPTEPAFEGFAERYRDGGTVLLATRLIADLETPVSAFLKLSAERRGRCFLLESIEGGAARGRYSMIGLDPDVIFRASAGRAEIARAEIACAEIARDAPDTFVACPEPPLAALRALIAESRIADLDERLPPMAAGVFGYLGYDMVREMERLPPAKPDPVGVPDSMFMRPTVMVVFDTVRDEIAVVTPVRASDAASAGAAYAAAERRLSAIVRTLEGPLPSNAITRSEDVTREAAITRIAAGSPASNTTPERFLAMVARAKDYIAAGDVFQVVLSQRFSSPFPLPPFTLYRALRRINPAPFLCYLDFGGFQIVCSSPEILVRVRDNVVTIRPIAGTRARGASRAEDEALAADLLADEKERAEHLMLLDLGRNDVGRVAAIGTVNVTERFAIERYSHVMHIVSNVEGRLDPRRDVIDALAAGFPAGTVSGAPKVRAMEIIDELETDKRGIYAGCVGYFGAGGEMDTCIVLRTAVVKDGVMHVQAGAGIVHDSDPASEQQECRNKARALFRAAEEAARFGSPNAPRSQES